MRWTRKATTAVALARFQRMPRFFMRMLITTTTACSRHSTAHWIATSLPLLVVAHPILLGLEIADGLLQGGRHFTSGGAQAVHGSAPCSPSLSTRGSILLVLLLGQRASLFGGRVGAVLHPTTALRLNVRAAFLLLFDLPNGLCECFGSLATLPASPMRRSCWLRRAVESKLILSDTVMYM